jgi:hypothetical protein
VNAVEAMLFSEPSMVVDALSDVAEVSTGKFWRLFAPLSASPVSLGVTPPTPVNRSMPSCLLLSMRLPRMALPVLPLRTLTPDQVL